MIFIDTNVILDVVRDDPLFAQRSARAIYCAPDRAVGPVVYAEVGAAYTQQIELNALLGELGIRFATISAEGAFLGGQAYLAYRRRGGPREQILADFLVGGQAAAERAALLTRDPARYRTAYPELELIEP